MTDDTQQVLADSLTAEDTALIPHLPYLLQDLWDLGSDPQEIIELLRRHGMAPVTRCWIWPAARGLCRCGWRRPQKPASKALT